MPATSYGSNLFAEVKAAARGRWSSIIQVRDASECPKCGGTDRLFRHTDFEEFGGIGCRGCNPNAADGIGAFAFLNNLSQLAAARQIAELLGLTRRDSGHSRWNKPGVTAEAIAAAGGKPGRIGPFETIRFSVTANGESTEPCGAIHFRQNGEDFPAYRSLPSRKSHNERSSRDGWLIIGRDGHGSPINQSAAIAECETIWCTEGVPDALALWSLLPPRHAVATNICGASARGNLDAQPLTGKTCYILGDSDEPGRKGAALLADNAVNRASRVHVLPEFAGGPGYDTRDFVMGGGTFEELLSLAARGEEILRKTPDQPPGNDGASHDGRDFTASLIDMADFCDLKITQDWLIDNVLVQAEEMIIGGPDKCLKTSIIVDMAISLATGDDFLGNPDFHVDRQRKVLLLSAESGRMTVQRLVRRICRAKQLHTGDLRGWLIYGDELPVIASDRDLSLLKEYIIAKGIAPKTLKKIININADRIVYVSCNPATQARDTVELMENGYQISKMSLVDQFPHTSHIETVVLFEKL